MFALMGEGNAVEGPLRVAVVDDHPVIRRGLAQLLEQEADLELVGETGEAHEALAMIRSDEPDLVIVDLSLGGQDGLQLVRQISTRHEGLKVLVLSMHTEKLYAERAIRAGAHGYIMKHEPSEELMSAIRRIRDGGIYVSSELQREWLQLMRGSSSPAGVTPLETLTDRELGVFRLIGSGRGTSEIAGELSLSVKTVETYRDNIKRKLGLQTATELVQYATLWLHAEGAGGSE